MASFGNGQQDVAAAGVTAEALVATATYVKSVTIRAKDTNTGIVYVGDSAVAAANGLILNPNDVLTIERENEFNLADIYVDVATSADGVSFAWVADHA